MEITDGIRERERMSAMGCAVVIPTYNNSATICGVVEGVKNYTRDIIVVDDGSIDGTSDLLSGIEGITVLTHGKNRGKGEALKTGLRHAASRGFDYAITIDSDSQHFPEDIPKLLDAIEREPGALIVGSRNLHTENMPSKNTFANRFSNFWFRLETGIKLDDTQSGFRAYPLGEIAQMKFFTYRYEFELEVIVRAAWKGIPVKNIPVRVHYPPEGERVSHFKPLRDFTRISLLNSVLVVIAAVIYWPYRFFKSLTMENAKVFMRNYVTRTNESNLTMSMSIALGVFWGIVPVWGYQMVVAGVTAHFLKLNKVIAILGSNISIPPMIPVIVYVCYAVGGLSLNRPLLLTFNNFSLEVIGEGLWQYIVGSVVVGCACALIFGTVSYVLMSKFRKGTAR
ncbi:MAG: DUF2062 domain-containing protein [Rikenellaceae bacterium]|nr:DUF2062 domain-containing protein [Rikenellaceae bacterium]